MLRLVQQVEILPLSRLMPHVDLTERSMLRFDIVSLSGAEIRPEG